MIATSNQCIDLKLHAQVNEGVSGKGQLPVKFTLFSFIVNSLVHFSAFEIDISFIAITLMVFAYFIICKSKKID